MCGCDIKNGVLCSYHRRKEEEEERQKKRVEEEEQRLRAYLITQL